MQVPLGILPLNENKTDEMVDIMKHIHDRYIPYEEYSEEKLLCTGETVSVVKARHHQIIVGGDQLTASRMRNAQKARLNSEVPADKFCGIVPISADWHIKANFLGVSLHLRYTYTFTIIFTLYS